MRKSVIPLSLAAAVGLGIVGCGGSADKPVVAAAKPAPTVTVTETAPPVTVTKEVTSKACLKALDEADKGFDLAGQSVKIMADYPSLVARAAEAGIYQDPDALNGVTADMKVMNRKIVAITVKIRALRYAEYAAQCRAAAE